MAACGCLAAAVRPYRDEDVTAVGTERTRRQESAGPWRIAVLLALALIPGCAKEHAGLDVTVSSAAASRFLAHGNCFVSWFLAVDLVVRETSGVDAILESASLRVEDTAGLLGETTVDAAALEAQFGPSGVLLPANGSLRVPMSIGPLPGPVDAPAIDGSIVASGTVVATDEQSSVSRAYRIPAVVTVSADPLPTGGACSPPAANQGG